MSQPVSGPVRVLLLLASLSGTGEERVALNLLDHCDPARVDVRLGLLRRSGRYLAETDPDRITAPNEWPGWFGSRVLAPRTITRILREARPQVLMTFGMGLDVYSWLALDRLGAERPVWICREDNNPFAELQTILPIPLLRTAFKALRQRIYKSADAFVSVSRDLARATDREYARDPARTQVIYNPTDICRVEQSSLQDLPDPPARPFIIGAGRLVPQKGFDVLIDAFAASAAARDMDLVILGEGPMDAVLRSRAASLGVLDRVRMPGFQANPWSWFARARLFVLSSRWEGFGNVVAEALACGVPTLVTDCDFGPREQITHGIDGWVTRAGDAVALAGALDTLLSDTELANRLAAAGKVRARDFDIDAVAGAYTTLFLENANARELRRR